MSNTFLDSNQLAVRIGVQPGTLRAWRMGGITGPAFVKFGRLVKYRLSDVIAWEESLIRHSTVGRVAA